MQAVDDVGYSLTSVEVTCVTLPKDHCVQVRWEYINVCGYSDQFCKLPHTYTYYILHTYYVHTTYRISDHIVSFWTTFRQDKKAESLDLYARMAELRLKPTTTVVPKCLTHRSIPTRRQFTQNRLTASINSEEEWASWDLNRQPQWCTNAKHKTGWQLQSIRKKNGRVETQTDNHGSAQTLDTQINWDLFPQNERQVAKFHFQDITDSCCPDCKL